MQNLPPDMMVFVRELAAKYRTTPEAILAQLAAMAAPAAGSGSPPAAGPAMSASQPLPAPPAAAPPAMPSLQLLAAAARQRRAPPAAPARPLMISPEESGLAPQIMPRPDMQSPEIGGLAEQRMRPGPMRGAPGPDPVQDIATPGARLPGESWWDWLRRVRANTVPGYGVATPASFYENQGAFPVLAGAPAAGGSIFGGLFD